MHHESESRGRSWVAGNGDGNATVMLQEEEASCGGDF
jgi:hypothetical protein